MKGRLGLVSPTRLQPGEDIDLIFQIASTDDVAYHIRSVKISPTWKPEYEVSVSVDKVVFPGTEKHFKIKSITVPPGIGGQQGFHVGLESAPFMDDPMDYETLWFGPLRLDVADSVWVDALAVPLGVSDSGLNSVNSLFENWAFNVSYVDTLTEFRSKLEDPDNQLNCVFGILTSEFTHDEEAVLEDAIDRALHRDIWPIIFKDESVEGLEFSPGSVIVECELSDEHAIERRAALPLYSARLSVEGDFTSKLLQHVKRRAAEKVRDMPETSKQIGIRALKSVIEALVLNAVLKETDAYVTMENLIQVQKEILSEGGSNTSREGRKKNRRVDLTHLSDSASALLEIRPFYQRSKVWRSDRWYEGVPSSTNDIFGEVVRNGVLPEVPVRFTLHWQPNISTYPNPRPWDGEMKENGTEVYRSDITNKQQILVPAEGTYIVKSQTGMDSWISFENPMFGAICGTSDREIGGNVMEPVKRKDSIDKFVIGCPTLKRGLSDSIVDTVSNEDPERPLPSGGWYID